MSLSFPVRMSEVHSELSCLLYAVQTSLNDLGATVEISYNQYTYLQVEITLWGGYEADVRRKMEAVVARLNHGILHDEYDYRFRGVSHPTQVPDWESVKISASVDLSHWPHRRTSGFDGYKEAVEWPLSAAGQPLATPARPQ